jgi:hypothetical protein
MRRKVEGGGIATDTKFKGGNRDKFTVMKVPRQRPLVLLVKVGWREGQAFRRGEGRKVKSGERREAEQGHSFTIFNVIKTLGGRHLVKFWRNMGRGTWNRSFVYIMCGIYICSRESLVIQNISIFSYRCLFRPQALYLSSHFKALKQNLKRDQRIHTWSSVRGGRIHKIFRNI